MVWYATGQSHFVPNTIHLHTMIRKINTISVAIFAIIAIVLPGCQAIADIFKAGVWVGIIIVVVILFVILAIGRAFKK